MSAEKRRLIVGISGASGAIYGIELLRQLAVRKDIETHLVISAAARLTIKQETGHDARDIAAMAQYSYKEKDISARIASGSFLTDGMLIVPCSIKSLSGIVHSYADNLLVRAADVILKERRKLVIAPRETPLHAGHLSLMHQAALMGAIIAPLMPAFYHRPQSIDDIVAHSTSRLLDLFALGNHDAKRWEGMSPG